MVRKVRKRRMGGELAPRVPLSHQHPPTIQTACHGPTTGCPLTMHDALQRSKRAQCGESSKPGFSSGGLQPPTQPTPRPLKHHLAQMSWPCTSIYESQSRHLPCSYGQERTASTLFYTRHACPLSPPPTAAVGGEPKQPNTSSSTAPRFLQPGISSGTVRDAFQTSNSYSALQKDFKNSPDG